MVITQVGNAKRPLCTMQVIGASCISFRTSKPWQYLVPGPARVARRRVHFVPPAQPDEPAPGDVFQVVEVGGQEQYGDYEDEDAGGIVG